MKYQLLILPTLLFTAVAHGATNSNNSTTTDSSTGNAYNSANTSTSDMDNTRINRRDRKSSELTADQQSFGARDTDITQRIRQDVMKETGFSTYAQNVKIITVAGKVTIKGPVRSEQELSTIMKHARRVAGQTNVKNEMSVEKEQ